MEQQGAQATLPIVFGAVLPDLPMFALYFWLKFKKLPDAKFGRNLTNPSGKTSPTPSIQSRPWGTYCPLLGVATG